MAGRPQVGVGEVAVVPTFKGFRSTTTREVDATTKDASSRFTKGFGSAGVTAGRSFADGFKQNTSSLTSESLKRAQDEVAKASREIAAARLKEQDATGKVRVAEAQLSEARERYGSQSSQVIRAEERLAAAQRQAETATNGVERATERLSDARRELASSTSTAATSSGSFVRQWGRTGIDSAREFSNGFRTTVGQIFTGNLLADVAFGAFSVVGRAAAAGFQYGFEGIQLASDLRESLNATRVAFGEDIAAQLEVLGSDAPQRLALSRRAFQQFATQFSAFAKTIRSNDPAGFIDELTTRAADFASVFNTDVDEALTLFQSGLAGETEPLRRFGIDLSAATVEAYAYRTGIARAGEELTEAEKQQARYGALLEQTNIVAGDNTNTANELAGQQRRLNVLWEESQTKIGEYLLPGFLSIVQYANSDLLPKVGEIIDIVGPRLGAALQEAGPEIQQLLDKVGPLAEKFAVMAADEGIPAFIDNLNMIADAAPGWLDAWSFLNDPNAQPAKFLNDLVEGLDSTNEGSFADGIRDGLLGIQGGFLDFFESMGVDVSEHRAALEEQIAAEMAAGIPNALQKGIEAGDFGGAREAFNNKAAGVFTGDQFGGDGSPTRRGGGGSFGPAAAAAEAGESLVGSFANAVANSSKFGAARSAAKEQSGIVAAQLDQRGSAYLSGGQFSDGFASGISSGKTKVGAAAKAIADEAVNTIKARMKIASPSKVTEEFGEFTTLGFALGMEAQIAAVRRASEAVSAAVTLGAAAASGAEAGSPALAGATIDARQYVTVAPEQDARIVGRQYGREFLREIAGDAP